MLKKIELENTKRKWILLLNTLFFSGAEIQYLCLGLVGGAEHYGLFH